MQGIVDMKRHLGVAAIAVFASYSMPALAQKKVEIGPDQPCTAPFGAGYPALTRFVPTEASPVARAAVRGVVVKSITWRPGETVKVCFRAGTQKARARVVKYASEWMNYANVVLDFGDKDNPRSCQGDNSEAIKIDFVEQGAAAGYWSQIGTNSRKTSHSMNLGEIGRDALPFPETEARRLTMHEFGHALGMLHEHQSPTGGCGPEYDQEALLAYGALLGWSPEKSLSNFIPYSASPELNASEVDRKSIMHYSLPVWIFKAREKSPCFVQPNYEISEGDRVFMSRVYPKAEVVATRGVNQPSVAQRRNALIEEYRGQLQKAGIEKGKAETLVKEFSETLPTK
jgi:hypothetical protein